MRNSFLLLALAATLSVSAADVTPTFTEWQDLQVNAVNRFPLHTQFFAYENRDLALKGVKTESSNFLSLDGKWKFKFVENADQRPTDFYKTDLDRVISFFISWGVIKVIPDRTLVKFGCGRNFLKKKDKETKPETEEAK